MEITIPILAFPPTIYIFAGLILLVVTAASTLGLLDRAAPIRLFLTLFVVWLAIQLLFYTFATALA